MRGHAARVLIEESERAHRIVVQRRRYARVRRVFTGSVSARVVAHAHCPVTVGPEGWSAEGRTGVVVGFGHDKSDDQLLSHADALPLLESQVIGEAPADALVTASATAGLIVVGRATQLNAFPHLDGVTRALLHEASCPVDVLPLPS